MAMPNNPGEEEQATIPCDYCNHEIALIFCRADSAKLCLFCDHHVHAANALSGKHLRSQICDGCRAAPVSVRCSTDNLLLCRECDWDAHGLCSASSSHDRTPIEGFTGCPSPSELTATWGLDLDHHHRKNSTDNPLHDSDLWANPLADSDSWMLDLMVPDESDVCKKSTCKQKNVVLRQLTELSKISLLSSDSNGGRGHQEKDVNGEDLHQENLPFTSLLMMQGRSVVDPCLQHNIVCNSKPKDHIGTQIWDFNMGRSASLEESDTGYEKNNVELMMSEDKTKTRLGEIHYPMGPTENFKIGNSSAPKVYGGSEFVSREDMEVLAKNRGDAMLRYMEKKKSRRYEK